MAGRAGRAGRPWGRAEHLARGVRLRDGEIARPGETTTARRGRRELDGRRAGLDDEAGREAMRVDWRGRAGVDDDDGAAETSSTRPGTAETRSTCRSKSRR